MFNNQNYNNEENKEGVYTNDNRLQRVGLYISDNFDQSSRDAIHLTEDNYSSGENALSHLLKTKIVPVRPFSTQKQTAVLPNGFSSIKIITNKDISQNIMQENVRVDGTHRSVFLMNDKMLSTGKCLSKSGGRQKILKDEYHAVIVHEPEAKIPRPPNAFMIFANEWRKKVADKYNNESNKDISVRLGHMWRSLDKSRKEEYFIMARKADAEHKLKYPDYVYNPKEARLRKALRDSWKDRGRRTPNGQFRSIVGKSPTNWSSAEIPQNCTLLPMPSLPNMTFSMAADGYSMMETPVWSNSWYSYRHKPVPYIVPQFPESYNGDSNDNYSDRMYHQMNVQEPGPRTNVVDPSQSPFADHNEPVENDKGPLSQLQELTNVFSSSTNTCNRNADNDIKQEIPATENDMKFPQGVPKAEVESTAFNNDSDSGYVTDHPHPTEAAGENDFNKNNPLKEPKQEPIDYPWNPHPSNYPTNDVDYFRDLCGMEEDLLDSHPMLSDSILMNPEEASKKNLPRKPRAEKPVQKMLETVVDGYPGTPFKGDEFLGTLSTVEDMDDFNMDELLKDEIDKFTANRRKE